MIVDRILGDRVLLKLSEAPKMTKSGIALPDRASHLQPRHGIVQAVGYVPSESAGYRPCLPINAGEMVVVPPKGGLELDVGGDRQWVFDAIDILAVVKEGDNGGVGSDREVVFSD